MLHQVLLLLHLLGAITWLGGMLFAHFCLRPAALEVLQPPQRLPLFAATFERFLRYTAFAVIVLLGSGAALLAPVGLRDAPAGWHAMLALGLAMAIVFVLVRLRFYPRLRERCAAADWPAAAAALNAIRKLVLLNLALGLCTVIAAVSAR
jgi:uncharacterized membrane protein